MAAQGPVSGPRIAIVGSGPSGFYAAEALLNAGQGITVDMYERLPVPFGLVRFGVAPDHAKLKSVTSVFTRIGQSEGFRYFGNVSVGLDIGIDDLRRHYHAVIVACGAEREKALNIPGETLAGSYSAREFVAWYNGHPDYRDLAVDLNAETAVVIGHGNVSLDAARILLKPVDELARTDIADHTLEVLAESRVRKVHIVGRRGPAQAKFTSKELREFGTFETCDTIIDPTVLDLGEACATEIAAPANMIAKSNMDLMKGFKSASAGAFRQCHFDFYRSPVRIDGANGRVASVCFERTRLDGEPFRQAAISTGTLETIDCGVVIRCIGYEVRELAGLPLDARTGVLKNDGGRLLRDGVVDHGLYAVGWAKRGPSGTIGTNRGDSVATVAVLLSDLPTLGAPEAEPDVLLSRLALAGHRIVSFSDWQKIDAVELANGAAAQRPRQKLTRVDDMLAAAGM